MTKGKPILISRGVDHKFRSDGGCVIEEISTTHIPGDSIYKDPEINTLPLSERSPTLDLPSHSSPACCTSLEAYLIGVAPSRQTLVEARRA